MEKDEKPKIGTIKTLNEVIQETKDEISDTNKLAQKAEEEGNINLKDFYLKKIDRLKEKYQKLLKERKDFEEKEKSGEIIRFDDSDLDSGLNIASSIKFLGENELPLPSRIKKESYKNIKKYQRKAERLAN